MEQVTKNVYTITDIRGSNPSIVFTKEGSVFIDTAQLLTPLLEMRKFALDKGPIRYLINTEGHTDHIFGNHWFAGECPVVGHENLPRVFWKNPFYDCYDFSVDVLKRQDPEGLKYMPAREDFIVNPPSITFSDRMGIKLGNHHFQLYYTPGHTDCNISVFVPEERTIFVGDTVFAYCQTWLQVGDPFEWLQSLEFLKTLDFDTIVPGHGPLVDKSYLDAQRAIIYEWISAVAVGISKGWSLEECKKRINFADRCPVDIGQEDRMEFVQTRNVECVYNMLMDGKAPGKYMQRKAGC